MKYQFAWWSDETNFPTDLVAQTMLGNLADRKGRNYAIFLNTTSVLLTSVFTLFARSYL
jgi:hypothetical protein